MPRGNGGCGLTNIEHLFYRKPVAFSQGQITVLLTEVFCPADPHDHLHLLSKENEKLHNITTWHMHDFSINIKCLLRSFQLKVVTLESLQFTPDQLCNVFICFVVMLAVGSLTLSTCFIENLLLSVSTFRFLLTL